MNEKFKFEKENTTLRIIVKGFFKEEDGKAYMQEYTNQINAMDSSKMDLILDCTELSVTTQDLLPMLQVCFDNYKKDNFKKVTAIIKEQNQAILAMQLNKLAKNSGLDQFELIKVK